MCLGKGKVLSLLTAVFKFPIRWSLKMSSQSPMVRTVWMVYGNSATPPSLCQSTGATASCLLSLVSLFLCSGASCLHASPSATSGLWSPASRAAWLSRSASAASILSAFRPSATPSLKPWARFSAVCVLHCEKKSKCSTSSIHCMISWIFLYTTRSILESCFTPCYASYSLHHMLLPTQLPWTDSSAVHFATRSSVTAAASSGVAWQPAQGSSLREEGHLH